MLLRQAAGPYARPQTFERFRLADASKGIPYYLLDDTQETQGRLSIRTDPIGQVFPKLRLKDRNTLSLLRHRSD